MKMRISIDTVPMAEDERKIDYIRRPRSTMFSRRFNPADIELWNNAAKKLNMSTSEFLERTMTTAANAVLEK